jgi:phosphoglycerate kinase
MLDLDRIRSLQKLDVIGRRVFVRADLDGAFSPQGAVRDDAQLRELLPTLRYLVRQRAKVVVATRLTTADREASRLAMSGVAERMSELLGAKVRVLSTSFEREIKTLAEGEVALAPDLAWVVEETSHDDGWAAQVASSVDVYVQDGLASALAGGTSVEELPRRLGTRGVGLAVAPALDMLHDALAAPAPETYSLVLGGPSLRRLDALARAVLPSCNNLLVGGAVANTFLLAQGWRPGGSPHDPDEVAIAQDLLALAGQHGTIVHTPLDAVVRTSQPGQPPRYQEQALDRALLPHEAAIDIGAQTCVAYSNVLVGSATVLWAGLLGDCSSPETRGGSLRVAQTASLAARAMAVGEETVRAMRDFRLNQQFQCAAGGDAVVALLAGADLPGLAALQG